MIDTHAHILDSQKDYPFYRPVNSYPILSMSTSPEQWPCNQRLSSHYPEVYYAVGVHPWFVSHTTLSTLDSMELFLDDNKCLAVGEIGLDFSPKFKSSQALQREFFYHQCCIAEKFNRPVSIHAVKCHNEMFKILKAFNLSGVVHGLSASKEVCHQYLRLGFKIGINASVCRPMSKRIIEMLTDFPLSSFVLETDFPNISDSLDMNPIINKISQLSCRSKDEVIEKTTYNAEQIFKFGVK
ncbi:TatD family hydrolase [Thiomicrorhabdus indica]|uniref:TatD family hydrolase n=1 Tax=Thiomicrorhabdus indica TaxID=2267253 RepID=UPI002AA94887|nr:TatD family hydrolase [Thiomicrorhabdus indica]